MIIFGLPSLSLKKHQFHWQQDHSTSKHEGFFFQWKTRIWPHNVPPEGFCCVQMITAKLRKPSSGAGQLCWDSCLGEDTTYHIFLRSWQRPNAVTAFAVQLNPENHQKRPGCKWDFHCNHFFVSLQASSAAGNLICRNTELNIIFIFIMWQSRSCSTQYITEN